MYLHTIPTSIHTWPTSTGIVLLLSETDQESSQCWLTIVYHLDGNAANFQTFKEGMLALPAELRPATIIDTIRNYEEQYSTPTLDGTTWIASHDWNSRSFFAHKLNISYGTGHDPNINRLPKLESMEFISAPLSPLPEEAKRMRFIGVKFWH